MIFARCCHVLCNLKRAKAAYPKGGLLRDGGGGGGASQSMGAATGEGEERLGKGTGVGANGAEG